MISEEKNDLDRLVTPPGEEARSVSPTLPIFKLQPDPQSTNSDSSSLEELLRYHDHSFVRNAYQVVLRRSPTAAEVDFTVGQLRTGKTSKIEIIEALTASTDAAEPRVVVTGLPSATTRKISKLPLIGYLLRVFRAVTRLPVMMQDQQRFESYAIAQQQRIADFLNDKVRPAVNSSLESRAVGELRTMVADAVESVLMLSDSIIELAAKQTEFEENLVHCEEQLKQISSQLPAVELAQRELQSHVESLSREPSQLHSKIVTLQVQQENSESRVHQDLARVTETLQALQDQREQSETVLHQDLERVTESLIALQKRFEEFDSQSATNNEAQREFLIQEQRLIVETQKVALKELEIQLTETRQETAEKLRSLSDIVRRLEGTETDKEPDQPAKEQA